MVFGAGDDTGLVVRRQPHRLSLVELGILKGREPQEAVPEAGIQPLLGDVDLVAEDEFERVGQLTADRRLPATTRRRRRPRLDFAVVLRRETNTEDATTAFRVLDDPFDLIAADLG